MNYKILNMYVIIAFSFDFTNNVWLVIFQMKKQTMDVLPISCSKQGLGEILQIMLKTGNHVHKYAELEQNANIGLGI